MTWTELDWPALDRLRSCFLRGTTVTAPYWQSPDDLASYDFTYGERIGWKWDHVLRELRLRLWRPCSRTILDWGCGSGIAARRVISFFGAGEFESLAVWDHSPLAAHFAAESAQRAFPALRVSQATPGFLAAGEPIGLLVVSHVLSELSIEALAALRALVLRADAVLWVEPGTHEISRRLGSIRDELGSAFHLVAPCTHQKGCPMFERGNERHWCHFFAPPPTGIFADSDWVKFGLRAGIDLRSLPYSFVALERPPALAPPASVPGREGEPPPSEKMLSRVIGRPEHLKAWVRLLNCDAAGLNELEVPKRVAPALCKQLERSRAPLVYRWRRDGSRILGGEPLL